jgi:hypothetical protein
MNGDGGASLAGAGSLAGGDSLAGGGSCALSSRSTLVRTASASIASPTGRCAFSRGPKRKGPQLGVEALA